MDRPQLIPLERAKPDTSKRRTIGQPAHLSHLSIRRRYHGMLALAMVLLSLALLALSSPGPLHAGSSTPWTLPAKTSPGREIRGAPARASETPPLDEARDAGAADPNDAPAPSAARSAEPDQYLFSFGPPSAPLTPGWRRVTATTSYAGTGGFGWDSSAGLTEVDQGAHNFLDRSFVRGSEPRVFRADVPNGVYEVWVLVHNAQRDVSPMSMSPAGRIGQINAIWLPFDDSGHTAFTAIAGYPTTDYRWGITVTEKHLDIGFTSPSGTWQVNALAIRRQASAFNASDAYEVAVGNRHTAPATTSLPVFTVPRRFWFTSDYLGDEAADWAYVSAWRDSVVTGTMTPAEKFRAVSAAISRFAGPWSPSHHPVDVLRTGNGACTGVANLMTMVAWTLGLPARNLIIYADSGLQMGTFPLNGDPYHSGEGIAHEISEVYLDGQWAAFDTGSELQAFPDFLVAAARNGTIPQFHRYAARAVDYHGWDGTRRWGAMYGPSTATLLYPNQAVYQYRLRTHDPRTPRSLRIDDQQDFSGPPLRVVPGVSTLEKTFWIGRVLSDTARLVSRIPIVQEYSGIPRAADWYLKVNGREVRLGRANVDFGAGIGQMIEVELPPDQLTVGWNTLEIGAHTPNAAEALVLASSPQATTSRTTLVTTSAVTTTAAAVWFVDVEYSAAIDPGSPASVQDLRALNESPDSVVLSWGAARDTEDYPPLRYEVRYGKAPINETSWSQARVGITLTSNLPAGRLISQRVEGLAPATEYHFAVRSFGRRGGVSPISNVASASTAAPKNGKFQLYVPIAFN